MKQAAARTVVALLSAGIITCGTAVHAWAHQPVMDMTPRWKGGYGIQTRHVWRGSDQVIAGDSNGDNPLGRKKRVNTTWFEGVYTFKREVRITFKIPFVDQSRTIIQNGVPVQQKGHGLGDAILALPLKMYTNRGAATWNYGFTPSIRLPTGSTSDSYPVGDGSTDLGLSLSYSHETPGIYQFYELFYWNNTRGKKGIAEGDELGLDANVGLHPYHSNETNSGIFVMWDVSARYKDRGIDGGGTTGGVRLSTGPVFVYYRGNMMFRTEYKYPVYEKVNGSQVSYGPEVSVGLGLAF